MNQNKFSSLIGFSFVLGIVITFIAGIIGIGTPFVAFSYFILTIGLLLMALAEVGFFLLICVNVVIRIKEIIKGQT
jgi:hypothetical protein